MISISNKNKNPQVKIKAINLNGENFYKLSNSDQIPPFFMNIVSDANHWMFISSNGGLSAGRKDANNALFPYYTVDKITESAEITGNKSILIINKNGKKQVWEPISDRFDGMYEISRNLYKNIYGNKIIFEEINHTLELTYRYQWNSSKQFGFVKKTTLLNNAETETNITILDGIQNIMPYGVESDVQNSSSNLVDAYKKNELEKEIGLGIYSLSAIIIDRAEPSEALKANVAWSIGFEKPKYLISSLQLKQFRKKETIQEETDIRAEKGAYFINAKISLPAKEQKDWMIIANVNQNHASISRLSELIKQGKGLSKIIHQDIEVGTQKLIELNAAADGLQLTADSLRNARHFSNALFNIMRGGIFDYNYQIEKWDFCQYLENANKVLFKKIERTLLYLPTVFSLKQLKKIANKNGDSDFQRLCYEYMPLKFSRRHGDPSRPWNKFSINTQNEVDGSKILDYQGNWRDIFQNWEALAHSFPNFIENMIFKFLNASTFDGYNPYRITKDGFDWETIEADDPWSYIGYWGDHQIIYLLKFLEFSEKYHPRALENYFNENVFVYANIPYKIKSYEDILKTPKDTILFDHKLDQTIRQNKLAFGADAALLKDENGITHKVNFIEKILATILAKLSNFIPEAGIWMNTQRPEWNDANNALVGNGVSMVTLYYLRRFLIFFDKIFQSTPLHEVEISVELGQFFHKTKNTFEEYQNLLIGAINNRDRKTILDDLGKAASQYRLQIYEQSFSGKKQVIRLNELRNFVELSLKYLDHSIKANKRKDGLYHAYNLMTIENEKEISISYLSEMLEGQVAILSADFLASESVLTLLDTLKKSRLYRVDQYSYMLYPNKDLARFRDKNIIPGNRFATSTLLKALIQAGNTKIVEKGIKGKYYFNGNFRNAADLKLALEQLTETKYATLVKTDEKLVLKIFEEVFNHKAFTGRSGTFFGYEGLGSIYWHMVSKLLLAVQECYLKAIERKEDTSIIKKLLAHYYEINRGIGVHKSPKHYGAFPTDPYSHTPAGRGVQQPGMTGQVKEDLLCRFGELGIWIKNGQIHFDPCLLRKEEFLAKPDTFNYVDVHNVYRSFHLTKNTLGFTYCQVPIIYQLSKQNSLELKYQNNGIRKKKWLHLDAKDSQKIFERTGEITQIKVSLNEAQWK